MNALPQLIAQAPTIIGNLVQSIAANLPQILQTGVKIPRDPRQRPGQRHTATHRPDTRHRALHLERFHSVNWGRGRHEHHHRHRLGRRKRCGKLVDAGRQRRQGRAELGQGQARHPFTVPRVPRPGRRDDRPGHGRGHRPEPAGRQPQPRQDSRRAHARRPLFGSPLIDGVTGGTGMLRDDREQTAHRPPCWNSCSPHWSPCTRTS